MCAVYFHKDTEYHREITAAIYVLWCHNVSFYTILTCLEFISLKWALIYVIVHLHTIVFQALFRYLDPA